MMRARPYDPNGRKFWQCYDATGCETRASAYGVLCGFRYDGCAAKTPPGMALLAVLRETKTATPSVFVEMCVRRMLPDVADGTMASEFAYARTNGLIVDDSGTWRLGEGPRVDTLMASMPADGPHARAARAAILVTKGPQP